MRIKPVIAILLSGVLLILMTIWLLTIGTVDISAGSVLSVMTGRIFGIENSDVSAAQQIIIWNIRWQRIALALLVGGGLAVAGTCFQTMFKNPLADPFILGVSSGAALGAAAAMITRHTELMIVFAFTGALCSLAMVYLFSQRSGYIRSDQSLLLAGIACGAMFNAVLSAMMALNAQQMHMIIFWLMGSLTNYGESLKPLLVLVAAGLTVAMVYARDLDIMALGDEDARFLGVNVNRVRLVLLVSMTLMTGACVSVSGIIGFVGLVVPHMVRKLAGPGHFLLIPLSAVWGAILLLSADGLTRMAPVLSGIPVGVVTALIGSPFFLYILYSTARRLQ